MTNRDDILLVYSVSDRAVVSYDLDTGKIIDISRAPRRKDDTDALYPPQEKRDHLTWMYALGALIVAWIPVWAVIAMVRR